MIGESGHRSDRIRGQKVRILRGGGFPQGNPLGESSFTLFKIVISLSHFMDDHKMHQKFRLLSI
jgi:hypothetical protein